MQIVNIRDAKTHFSRLVDLVASGEEIIITKAGKPVARLIPIQNKKIERVFGSMKGKIRMSDDFDTPFPDDIIDLFEGH